MSPKSLLLSTLALAAFLSPLSAATPGDCTDLAREVTAAVAASPDKVVKLIAEFCAKNPACACDVVNAALVAAKADASLRAEIISAALEAAPDQAEAILACTKTPDPSGKAPVGKEPAGKEPAGKAPAGGDLGPISMSGGIEDRDTIDFGLFRAGIGGVYIGSPSSGSGRTVIETAPEETTTPQTPRRVIVRIPGAVSPIASSGTGDSASGAVLVSNAGINLSQHPGLDGSGNLTMSGSGASSAGTLTSGNLIINGSSVLNLDAALGSPGTFRGTIAIRPGAAVMYQGTRYTSENVGLLNSLLQNPPVTP